MKGKLALLLVSAALLLLALPGSASSAPTAPVPSCSPGPADCSGWHRESVTVYWSHGCGPTTISNDTGGQAVQCSATEGAVTITTTVVVAKDGSPPGVRIALARGPDNDGWYNHPVGVEFTGDDGLSGIASCSPNTTYGGPDGGDISVSGSCTDGAGNTGSGSTVIKYDATPPTVEAKPDRQPDKNRWYRRAVTVNFVGTDHASGIHLCTAPVQYAVPDAPKASLSGTCQDKAANTSQPAAIELSYDATPPILNRVKAEISRSGIALEWIASKDAESFTILRRPGLKGKGTSTVYNGSKRAFVDGRLRQGVKYRYSVTAFDQAGNGAVKGLVAQALATVSRSTGPSRPTRPASTLLGPAAGARLKAPPVLAWSAVRKATYYNVQLFRNGRKIFTAWPSDPTFRVPSTWKFGGSNFRLTPGVYRWYVWAGFGPRSANRYGKLLGTRSFEVVRG